MLCNGLCQSISVPRQGFWTDTVWDDVNVHFRVARQVIGDIEPTNSLAIEKMPIGMVIIRVIERTDVKLNDLQAGNARGRRFPRQRCPTLATEGTINTGRRLVELAASFDESNLLRAECHECDNRRAGMTAATQAVVIQYEFRFTNCLVPDRSTHASSSSLYVASHSSLLELRTSEVDPVDYDLHTRVSARPPLADPPTLLGSLLYQNGDFVSFIAFSIWSAS